MVDRDLRPRAAARRHALHRRPERAARPDPEAATSPRTSRTSGGRRGGVRPGEDFLAGAAREALEETGLRVRLRRYLVDAHALFTNEGRELPWRTHVLLAETDDGAIAAADPVEIAEARWGSLDELAGPLRERLLATGRAFRRYRVALHDAALAAMRE